MRIPIASRLSGLTAIGALSLFLSGCLNQAAPGPGLENELSIAKLQTTGVYRIVSVHSGKSLDVDVPTGKVQQWTGHAGNNQKWNIVHLGNGRHEIRNVATGKCLDVDWNAANPAANGQIVHTWDCHGGSNQRFYLEAFTPGGPGGENLFIIPGYTDQYSSTVLDVKDWSTANGGAIQQWTRTTSSGGSYSNNQYWKIMAP